MKRYRSPIIVVLTGIALLLGCESIDRVEPDNTILVIGNVYAYVCDETDPANGSLDPRYSVETGRNAFVTFTRIDGVDGYDDAFTHSPSQFAFRLAPGMWRAAIFTDHTAPDAFDSLNITSDTALFFSLRYDFQDPDTVVVTYEYALDGQGNIWEPEYPTFTQWINTLNADLGGMLRTTGIRHWTDSSVAMNRLWFLFAVPLAPDVQVWEVFATLGNYRFANELPEKYPDNMSLSARTYGLCPGDFEIEIDTTLYDSLGEGGSIVGPE